MSIFISVIVTLVLQRLIPMIPKIPSAEEIAELIREGIRAEMQEAWWAGATTGFLAGILATMFFFFRKNVK